MKQFIIHTEEIYSVQVDLCERGYTSMCGLSSNTPRISHCIYTTKAITRIEKFDSRMNSNEKNTIKYALKGNGKCLMPVINTGREKINAKALCVTLNIQGFLPTLTVKSTLHKSMKSE